MKDSNRISKEPTGWNGYFLIYNSFNVYNVMKMFNNRDADEKRKVVSDIPRTLESTGKNQGRGRF